MKKVAIYARVSTKDRQEVKNQLIQLRDYCKRNGYSVYKEFVDKQSGGDSNRTGFQQMFTEAHQGKFDIVLFWSLDRFTREGLRATINYLTQLEEYGIGFISFSEPYLNSLGMFRDAIIGLLATLAKQEKVRLSERVQAGLERARKQGKTLGRPKIDPYTVNKIKGLQQKGLSLRNIARKVKVGKTTVKRYLESEER